MTNNDYQNQNIAATSAEMAGNERTDQIRNIALSLADITGDEYVQAICETKAFIEQRDVSEFLEIAREKVEFFPTQFSSRMDELIDYTGKQVCDTGFKSSPGATTNAFRKATNTGMAPALSTALAVEG